MKCKYLIFTLFFPPVGVSLTPKSPERIVVLSPLAFFSFYVLYILNVYLRHGKEREKLDRFLISLYRWMAWAWRLDLSDACTRAWTSLFLQTNELHTLLACPERSLASQPAVTRHTHLSLAGMAIVDRFSPASYLREKWDKWVTKSLKLTWVIWKEF